MKMRMRIETTVIANETAEVLIMKLVETSNQQLYFVDYATLERGGEHTMIVDYNANYQEFLLGVDTEGKNVMLSSDECCDYKRITITKVNGEFDVQKEARDEYTFPPKPGPAVAAKKINKCCQFGKTISQWAQLMFRNALAQFA